MRLNQITPLQPTNKLLRVFMFQRNSQGPKDQETFKFLSRFTTKSILLPKKIMLIQIISQRTCTLQIVIEIQCATLAKCLLMTTSIYWSRIKVKSKVVRNATVFQTNGSSQKSQRKCSKISFLLPWLMFMFTTIRSVKKFLQSQPMLISETIIRGILSH